VDIVLTTFNARYIHAAFGLRYLRANLGDLRERSVIHEFTIHERPVDAVEALLALKPKIIGIGVYIWNAPVVLQVVQLLKALAPEVKVVLGGPEVSFEWEEQPVVDLADAVVTGQGEVAFRELCATYLAGQEPPAALVHGGQLDPKQLAFPYDEYTDTDVAHRVVYVEASRGCPFRCEFCLSSLDKAVSGFPLEPFLEQMDRLFQRGVRQFKFVDRTFNLKMAVSQRILQFFLDRYEPGLFVHFEMIPDRLPASLRALIAAFPAGALQFEVGIQTFNPEVAGHISRRQNLDKLHDNFAFLRDETHVHVHADLIAGLPGETVASFAAGFDRLVALGPQEIQVGVLKRLRGTPIIRHTEDHGLVFSPAPPYEVLRTAVIPFEALQELKRFARFWDLVGNSGNFSTTLPLILGDGPFAGFSQFAQWVWTTTGAQHGIALRRLVELVFTYLTEVRGLPADVVGHALADDYTRPGRRRIPPVLHPYATPTKDGVVRGGGPRRQARHLGTA